MMRVKQLPRNAELYNGLALAYMGDAVYEQYVRFYLLQDGETRVKQMHRRATRFVSAAAQASVMQHWLAAECLSPIEKDVSMRGRNTKSKSVPKNADPLTYRWSTAFESLLGYLYLSGQQEKLDERMGQAVSWLRQSEGMP